MPVQSARQVFVLGAGFTRAFYAGAPLVQDSFDVAEIRERIRGLPLANMILEAELAMFQDGNTINIERLLTRVHAPLPYDDRTEAPHEMGILRNAVIGAFRSKLDKSKGKFEPATAMHGIAGHCLRNGVNCITFNYDDLLDEALYEVSAADKKEQFPWAPNVGYGFPCPHAVWQRTFHVPPDGQTACTLLKLHGSINWRVERGTSRPYRISDFVDDSDWFPEIRSLSDTQRDSLEVRTENEPVIVPPILAKADLLDEPLLRLLWGRAHKCLCKAERVVFIGYAMSETDVAAKFLFSEAMQAAQDCEVVVVNSVGLKAKTEQERKYEQGKFRVQYGRVFGETRQCQWEFRDTKEWCDAL